MSLHYIVEPYTIIRGERGRDLTQSYDKPPNLPHNKKRSNSKSDYNVSSLYSRTVHTHKRRKGKRSDIVVRQTPKMTDSASQSSTKTLQNIRLQNDFRRQQSSNRFHKKRTSMTLNLIAIRFTFQNYGVLSTTQGFLNLPNANIIPLTISAEQLI